MSEGRWKRPESVRFPTVWRRFKGKKPLADSEVPEFWIQDVTEDLLEDVVDHMAKFFLRDEPISKAVRFLQDEQSVHEIKDIWRGMARIRKLSLVALTQQKGVSKPTVVGANMLTISHKDDIYDNSKCSRALKKLEDVMDVVSRMVDLFQLYSLDEYLSSLGLSVDPEWRGQGIGEELLLARRDICSAVGLKLTATVFSAVQSQKLATRVGFDTLRVVPYNEYLVDGEVVFKTIVLESGVDVMKLQALKVD